MKQQQEISLLAIADVAVMDDKIPDRQEFARVLESIGCRVETIPTKDEAVALARKRPHIVFCLDIDMGVGREQEGLTALERIKELNNKTKVVIRSAYPDRFQRLAQKSHVDYFLEKTGDTTVDAYTIVKEILIRESAQAAQCIKYLEKKLSAIQSEQHMDVVGPHNIDDDPNVSAYQRLRSDPRWLRAHVGSYVALIDGKLVDEDSDKDRLLARLEKKYPEQLALVKQIEAEDRIVEMPTPLLIAYPGPE